MNDSIKMGDVVRLKSGGPLMTVGEIVTAEMVAKERADNEGETLATEGEATCAWFEIVRGGAYVGSDPPWGGAQAGTFHVDMLVKADPPAKA